VDIMACVVGRAKRKRFQMFHLSEETTDVGLIFPFWIVRGRDGKPILVDMGFPQDACASHHVEAWSDPADLLAAAGVAPGDIETIVVSHLHWDHFNRPDRFPNAAFWIQDADIQYFTKHASDPAAYAADAPSVATIAGLEREGRVHRVDGEAAITGGVRVVKVGGHTPGMQITVCESGDERYVLACDASHFYANFEKRTPSGLFYRYDEFQNGLAQIATQAGAEGRWFPGHDPAMLERMTEEAPGLYRATR
jgi:glyoxylase-like metal-dependent hydrolase (beta-lactamase superfamily II)